MKLTATALKYEHTGEDGYSFSVDAVHDAEFGWSAYVSMAAHGRKTPEAAIQHLRHSAEAFLRAVEEMES